MKTFLKLCALAAVIALPGMASATVLTSVTGTADCDGYNVTATIHWGAAPSADITYDAMLVDGDGATVAHVTYADVLTSTGNNTYQVVTYSQPWGADLCGSFTATVTATLEATVPEIGYTDRSEGSFTADFDCTCEAHVCNYTPGYWKNHPENWPVMELSLGGVAYTQAQLLDILDTPVRGDATIILAYHLIAAKLNVLSGSDPGINDAIDAADALLMQFPLFSKPTGDDKTEILRVKDQLADYNELECPDGPVMDSMGAEKTFTDEEASSWSQLKASYR